MKFSPSEKRLWLIASTCGVVGAVFILALFRVPRLPGPKEVGKHPPKAEGNQSVGLARLDDQDSSSRLRDEALLHDPTPLFLPTRWNVGENALPANARQEPGATFRDYAPKLSFPVADLRLGLPAPIAVPKRVPDIFDTDTPKRPYLGFGQADASVEALPRRTAYVEVAAVADGGLALAEPIIASTQPPETNWQPLEFLVAIDRAGLVKPATLMTSSQVSSVDAYFRDFLSDGLHIGERLAPGFYRVSIGP